MSFNQKNTTVTLANFTLILIFFLLRISQLVRNDNFTEPAVFRVWAIVIVLAVLVSILAIILTHALPVIVRAIKTGEKSADVNDLEDERDKFINLKGVQATQVSGSIGVFIAMLSYAFGQPALVMFSLLIFFTLVAQVIGDIRRLMLYQRGF